MSCAIEQFTDGGCLTTSLCCKNIKTMLGFPIQVHVDRDHTKHFFSFPAPFYPYRCRISHNQILLTTKLSYIYRIISNLVTDYIYISIGKTLHVTQGDQKMAGNKKAPVVSWGPQKTNNKRRKL